VLIAPPIRAKYRTNPRQRLGTLGAVNGRLSASIRLTPPPTSGVRSQASHRCGPWGEHAEGRGVDGRESATPALTRHLVFQDRLGGLKGLRVVVCE
jgi:hypothetical protein